MWDLAHRIHPRGGHYTQDRETDGQMIVMDFSKASNKAGHERLHHKLVHYMLSKCQRQDSALDLCLSGSGVLQSSALGPCLFFLYINDLPEGLGSGVRLFAVDTIVYRNITSTEDVTCLQSDLDKIASWKDKSKMEFHQKKCQVFTITNNKKRILCNYILHAHTLERVTEAKNRHCMPHF